jgi:hypothetical protein
MVAQQAAIDLAGEAAVVDGEVTTMITTTHLHRITRTTRTIQATPKQATARHRAGGLASGPVLQAVLPPDGLLVSSATEGTGTTRLVAGALEAVVAVAGTMVVKEAQEAHLVIVSPAPGMKALGLEGRHADDELIGNFLLA